MDAVMDLTARAAAYVVVIQQLCIDNTTQVAKANETFHLLKPSEKVRHVLQNKAVHNLKFQERAIQLIWINNTKSTKIEVARCLLDRTTALLDWMWDDENCKLLQQRADELDSLPSQERWRHIIGGYLYQHPKQRILLAQAISYLPIQIVLACGGQSYGTLSQRILQEWKIDPEDYELKILASEKSIKDTYKIGKIDFSLADQLLESDDKLLTHTNLYEVPLSFEMVLSQELKEIDKNRKKRIKEFTLAGSTRSSQSNVEANPISKSMQTEDPIQNAKSMGLKALAFSGGGIRSATFNLGILQGISKAGLLSHFDYLSTVSGGGYIGSWLVSWIKREGSVIKVSDRLNSDKSTDPMAEEVRPIRWLRMYSNYLTPNSGIMSADSWTVGMTLIRNMLLNQLIILLLLLTLLLTGRTLYIFWIVELIKTPTWVIFVTSTALVAVASVLAGSGMRFYHQMKEAGNSQTIDINVSKKSKTAVSAGLLAIGCFTAVFASPWLFANPFPTEPDSFSNAFKTLAPSAIAVFIALVLVAGIGRYDRCIPFEGLKKAWGIFLIVIFSAAAAAIGTVLMIWLWELIDCLKFIDLNGFKANFPDIREALAFILSPPLVLEVFTLTIVMRMALLGKYFPDERREWWGRMGGIVHQLSFLWILIAGAALLGKPSIDYFFNSSESIVAAAGGWGALVITAVKVAFSSKSGSESQGSFDKILNVIALMGPYLFGLGLLVFLPVLLNNLLDSFFYDASRHLLGVFLITACSAALTMILAWRIGVNEFSMHHFYKNRLVRAYLGATRNRTERKNTSSPFTGFDNRDDVLLSDLIHDKGYYGPYPILNTTLNASQVSQLDRQDRKSESFVFSPLYCGFDFSRTRSSASANQKSYDYGFRQTVNYAYQNGGPHIGSAMAISGAAANPNQGSHSSPATAFLLTAFNVRLGWWIGNPRKNAWKSSDPELGITYLISNLVGKTNTKDRYVCLSDGGHFDNMGLYELIRRRTSVIILGDGEQDDKFTCEGLANAIRRCRIDFGVEINIDVTDITNREGNFSAKNYAVGKIYYPGEIPHEGYLIYIKSSITEKEAVDVREYSLKNSTFPHQTTGDQFFDESQFESYRKLGLSIVEKVLADYEVRQILNI